MKHTVIEAELQQTKTNDTEIEEMKQKYESIVENERKEKEEMIVRQKKLEQTNYEMLEYQKKLELESNITDVPPRGSMALKSQSISGLSP